MSKQKDEQLVALQAAVRQRDHALEQMVDKFNDSAQKFEKMKQGYIQLQAENRLLSQVLCKLNFYSLSAVQSDWYVVLESMLTAKRTVQSTLRKT